MHSQNGGVFVDECVYGCLFARGVFVRMHACKYAHGGFVCLHVYHIQKAPHLSFSCYINWSLQILLKMKDVLRPR